jgi:hypothetical protein
VHFAVGFVFGSRTISSRMAIISAVDTCSFRGGRFLQRELLGGHHSRWFCVGTLAYAARYCVGDVAGERRDRPACHAAFNRGDVDAALKFFAPEAELVDLASAPDRTSGVKGIAAIREAWTLWTAAVHVLLHLAPV